MKQRKCYISNDFLSLHLCVEYSFSRKDANKLRIHLGKSVTFNPSTLSHKIPHTKV